MYDPAPETIPPPAKPSDRKVLLWALLFVPLIVALGSLSGALSGPSADSLWFQSLEKPAIYPPSWIFGVVWTILYALMGFSLALVVASPVSAHRKGVIIAFAIQLFLNLCWSPIFFGAQEIGFAFLWILVMLVLVMTTFALFWRISRVAALLLVPYLAWVGFAAVLNLRFLQLNGWWG